MAMVKKKQNDLAGAIALWEEAKAGQAEALGTKHPSYLITLYNMADALEAMHNLDEALIVWQELVALDLVVYGAEHDETVGDKARLEGCKKKLDVRVP